MASDFTDKNLYTNLAVNFILLGKIKFAANFR